MVISLRNSVGDCADAVSDEKLFHCLIAFG